MENPCNGCEYSPQEYYAPHVCRKCEHYEKSYYYKGDSGVLSIREHKNNRAKKQKDAIIEEILEDAKTLDW